MFLYASLQLRCYYFLEWRGKSSLREGILRAYQSALSLIRALEERETEVQLLSRGPVLFQNALSVASTLTLKILRSHYSQMVDVEEGRRSFKVSVGLMRKCSLELNDLPGKFSKILAQLWHTTPDEGTQSTGLSVTTRLAGSLLHDAIWKWSKKYGRQSSVSAGSPSSPVVTPGSVIRARPARIWSQHADGSSGQALEDLTTGHEAHVTRSDPAVAESRPYEDIDSDLIDEMNNEWCWSSAGLSGLLAIDLDATIFPSDFSMGNNDNDPPQ